MMKLVGEYKDGTFHVATASKMSTCFDRLRNIMATHGGLVRFHEYNPTFTEFGFRNDFDIADETLENLKWLVKVGLLTEHEAKPAIDALLFMRSIHS